VCPEAGIDSNHVVVEDASPGEFLPPEMAGSALPESRSALDPARDPDGNAIDEDTEGCIEFSQRVLTDPWSEPAARRAIGFAAARKVGEGEIALTRVDLYPIEGTGHSLAWLCFGGQSEIDDWRFTNPDAEAVLHAVERWLDGTNYSLESGLANSFPLSRLFDELQGNLDERQRTILAERCSGKTLDEISTAFNVTRQRILQIETNAAQSLGSRIVNLHRSGHPAVLALLEHAQRLAKVVLAAASEAEGTLLEERKHYWIGRSLSKAESVFIGVLLRVLKETAIEKRTRFDPFKEVGHPLANGRSALPWTDSELNQIRSAFDRLTGDGTHPWASAEAVAAEARVPSIALDALAPLIGLIRVGRYLVPKKHRVSDVRRAAIADILASAGRAMHYAEITEALIESGFASWLNVRDIQNAMTGDPTAFVTDAWGLWQLRSQLGDTVEDRRSEHPLLSPVWEAPALREEMDPLADYDARPANALLEDLDVLDPAFAVTAGSLLAAALDRLTQDERRSVAEVLTNPTDLAILCRWLAEGNIPHDVEDPDTSEGGVSSDELIGLTIIAGCVAAIRETGDTDTGPWAPIKAASGVQMASFLFDTMEAPRDRTTSRFVLAARAFRLRRAFEFKADPWQSLLVLQAGILPNDLRRLPAWLSAGRSAPIAIRHLVAPGPNHSRSLACLWNVFIAFRRGNIGLAALDEMAARSPWWPGWAVDDARVAIAEPYRTEPKDGTAVEEPVEQETEVRDWNGAEKRAGKPRTRVALGQRDPTATADRPLGTPRVWPDYTKAAFVMALPDYLRLTPGAVSVHGDGFRIGGSVGDDGAVRWHSETAAVRMSFRGSSARRVSIERGGESIASQSIKLWDPSAYIVIYDLASPRRGALDPYMIALSTEGQYGLLLHANLAASVEPDDDFSLDGSYTLKIYRSGIPVGLTVSCGGEVVWEAEYRAEARRVLDVYPAVLTTNAGSGRWGGDCDLIVSGLPDGFEPSTSNVGAQTMRATRTGASWRFNGYKLMPGMDALRRRGRVDGWIDGGRASVPAIVRLDRVPSGNALRDARGWRPLPDDKPFDKSKDGLARLWISRPAEAETTEWVLFEGATPVARYGLQGVHLASRLLGLGETLSAAPNVFNIQDALVRVSATVMDSGVVADVRTDGASLIIRFTTPIEWTDGHKAMGWSLDGVEDVARIEQSDDRTEIRLAPQSEIPDAISLFHGRAWLGTAYLDPDPIRAVGRLLGSDSGWPDTLRFAVDARLPVLATANLDAIATRLRGDDGRGTVALCKAQPGRVRARVMESVLEYWEPARKLHGKLVADFKSSLGDGSGRTTILEMLSAAAPVAAVRVLFFGTEGMTQKDKVSVITALATKLLPADVRQKVASGSVGHFFADVENITLAKAVEATRLDEAFLAARGEGSIASLARAAVAAPRPGMYDPKLATALTMEPVRTWLVAHLFSRLADAVLKG
jgi:hypothetical protein